MRHTAATVDLQHADIAQTLRRLRELRDRMRRPRLVDRDFHDHRRIEDRIRDEYQDAHAKVIQGRSRDNRVMIRITKALPAPKMDGFDVSGFRAGHIYDVENRIGHYLLVAGYATAVATT